MTTSATGTAVVTGASSGIGAIYADRLARRGHDLILVARNRGVSTTWQSVSRTRPAGGSKSSRRISMTRLISAGSKHCCATTLVLRCWSTMRASVRPGRCSGSDVDKMDDMIALNVRALTRLTYAAAPGFVARGGGTIINIASIVGVAPEILNGVYGGTKAFVLALSLSLHKELADKNVRIQAVLPGATATDFWETAGTPIEHLPGEIVMRADDLVDAALAGLDQGELITIPSLPDAADWQAYEAARQKLMPNLSLSVPAARYRARAAA